MNERIKQLAEQATTEEADGFKYFDKEKFAELIVRECADIADFCDQVESVEAVSSVLKRYFGVEE
jgi:DNA polymerase III alpha subunit (gram-positive type)